MKTTPWIRQRNQITATPAATQPIDWPSWAELHVNKDYVDKIANERSAEYTGRLRCDRAEITLQYNLPAGDILELGECGAIDYQFMLADDVLLSITGTAFLYDGRYNSIDIPSIGNYTVIAPFGLSSDERVNTDIGGKYLYLNHNGMRTAIVHLHNGFGDGFYTLRFRGDRLVR